jgi:hypothetical protein
VMTDGRMPLLGQAVPSLANLHGPITRRVIHDDSGDRTYRRQLHTYFPDWEIIGAAERLGFAGAYRAARSWLADETDEEFIFSTEDDFVIQRPLDLAPLCYVLNGNPGLLQLAAKRQPCNPLEEAAGGVIEQRPAEYIGYGNGVTHWLEHRLYWTTNPHLTHRDTLKAEWPNVPNSEGMFTHALLRDGLGDVDGADIRFGIIGRRSDQPLALHIGTDQRIGHTY